jgi:hypothetical protein
MDWFSFAANISAIATALIAGATALWFWRDARLKRQRLERYLAAEKSKGADRGQRSILHVMTALGLTEAEVLQASFRSSKIQRRIKSDGEGMAAQMLLEYSEEA